MSYFVPLNHKDECKVCGEMRSVHSAYDECRQAAVDRRIKQYVMSWILINRMLSPEDLGLITNHDLWLEAKKIIDFGAMQP